MTVSHQTDFIKLGHDMEGAKRMGGGKRSRERALPKNFWTPALKLLKELLVCSVVFFVQEKQSNDTRGGVENVPYEGDPKPL